MKFIAPLLLLAVLSFHLEAQNVHHFVGVNYAYAPAKQVYGANYTLGVRRFTFSFGISQADGTDERSISADQLDNNQLKNELSMSQTFEPTPEPSNSFLENCRTTYTGKQYRIGMTGWLRNNDTLNRKPFTGPHAGIEFCYMPVTEAQTLTYKSLAEDMRYTFSETHLFNAIGAASHIGWQFCFLRERLYLDLRAVIPFFYPLEVEEPNLNSPFAGSKYEFQAGLSFHFGKRSAGDVPEEKGPKVRESL